MRTRISTATTWCPSWSRCVWAGLALDWAWDVALLGWRRGCDRAAHAGPSTRQQHRHRRRPHVCCWCRCCRPVPGALRATPTRRATPAPGEFLDATLAALRAEPGHPQLVELLHAAVVRPLGGGRRPDMTIIDDRTMLDEHLGSAGLRPGRGQRVHGRRHRRLPRPSDPSTSSASRTTCRSSGTGSCWSRFRASRTAPSGAWWAGGRRPAELQVRVASLRASTGSPV